MRSNEERASSSNLTDTDSTVPMSTIVKDMLTSAPENDNDSETLGKSPGAPRNRTHFCPITRSDALLSKLSYAHGRLGVNRGNSEKTRGLKNVTLRQPIRIHYRLTTGDSGARRTA